jgi:hypothetical protein
LTAQLESFFKTRRPTSAELDQAGEIGFNGRITEYFHPDTLREVLSARRFFLELWNSSNEWALLYACTLHLLHGNRPYALSRRSHPVTPFKPTGPFEYRALIPRLKAKLQRVVEGVTSDDRAYGESAQADSTITWPKEIPAADAIITSPPFFDSTRFYMTNWMRFWFTGWDKPDFDAQPATFLERRQTKDLDVYKAFFEAARERCKPTGIVVLHLGQSRKCDMAAELSSRAEPWLKVRDVFTECVEHCESHGIRDKGTVHGHSYVVLTPI